MLLKRRGITTIKEIDLLQENISLVFLKSEKQNIDSVRYQAFTIDFQTAKNSRTDLSNKARENERRGDEVFASM